MPKVIYNIQIGIFLSKVFFYIQNTSQLNIHLKNLYRIVHNKSSKKKWHSFHIIGISIISLSQAGLCILFEEHICCTGQNIF